MSILPYSLFIKPAGASCNLDCSYCYYLCHDDAGNPNMDLKLLNHTIRNHIQSQPEHSPVVDFIWHGGEPMLRGIDFYQQAMIMQKQWANGKTVANTIQTNGTLINQRWAEFFAQHNFMVGVSIDGPHLVHNIARIDKKGLSSFERTLRGIEALKKNKVEFNTLTVINNRSYQQGKAIYQFLKENGSHYMQFQPCIDHELDRRSDFNWSLTGEQWGRFLCDLFDEWCQEDITQVYVQFFENCLMLLMGQANQMCHHAKTCGQQLMMESDGQIYSCDHFGYPAFNLGEVSNTKLAEMVSSEQQRYFGENKQASLCQRCHDCDFKPLCNGGCPKNRTDKTEQDEPVNALCDGYRMFFRYALPRLLKMADAMKNGYSPQYYQLF